jgi:hypothetical protein
MQAIKRGVVVDAVCWYPLLDYPGWDDDRRCPAGVFGFPDMDGNRPVYQPLEQGLKALQARFGTIQTGSG